MKYVDTYFAASEMFVQEERIARRGPSRKGDIVSTLIMKLIL